MIGKANYIDELKNDIKRLKFQYKSSKNKELLDEIEELEVEESKIKFRIDNNHKELRQAVQLALRCGRLANSEDNKARIKVNRIRAIIRDLTESCGDFLSDPDAFIESFNKKLDEIVEAYEKNLSNDVNLAMEVNVDFRVAENDMDKIETLNAKLKRKRIIRAKIVSIDEEIRSQISSNSKEMPKSYPINDVFVEYIDPNDVIRVSRDESMRIKRERLAEIEMSAKTSPTSFHINYFEEELYDLE